jgi:glycosyltransferase involved in cell wall biosynthesis
MNVAGNFFSRYKNIPKIFDNPCSPKTGIVVVIPCYNDPHIFNTLESLESNKISYPEINLEVIVVVNSSIDTGSEILHINKEIYNKLLKQKDNNFYKNFKLLPCIFENIPPKIAGVGYARKIGMDEALRRFDEINNPDGVIISLDADTIVSKEYFNTIIDEFYIQKKYEHVYFNSHIILTLSYTPKRK